MCLGLACNIFTLKYFLSRELQAVIKSHYIGAVLHVMLPKNFYNARKSTRVILCMRCIHSTSDSDLNGQHAFVIEISDKFRPRF